MLKTTVKCPRCGKVHTLVLKEVREEFECKHCHKKMVLDKSSRTKNGIVRYLLSFLIVLPITLIFSPLQRTNGLLWIAAVILCSLGVLLLIDRYSFQLAFLLFGLNYIDVDEWARQQAEKASRQLLKKAKKKK